MDFDNPIFLEALDTIVAAARNNGIFAGIHCSSVEIAQRMIARGFQFVTVQTDMSYLLNTAKGVVAQLRGTKSETSTGIY